MKTNLFFIVIIIAIIALAFALKGCHNTKEVNEHQYLRIDFYSWVHDPDCPKCINKK